MFVNYNVYFGYTEYLYIILDGIAISFVAGFIVYLYLFSCYNRRFFVYVL